MSHVWTQAQILELERHAVHEVPRNGASAKHLDSIAEEANLLATHFNSRDPWVFLLYDKSTGQFHVYSNQSGGGVRGECPSRC